MDIQAATVIPEVQDTIVMLKEMSADEKIRQQAYYREKRLHDEATALGNARREGRAEGQAEERKKIINSMRKSGMSEEDIARIIENI